MAGYLSPAQVRSYLEYGYLSPLRVMSAQEADGFLRALRESEANMGSPRTRYDQQSYMLYPWVQSLVRHSGILDCVESILGADIVCYGGQAFVKDPGDAHFVSWHQDGTYWGALAHDVVTAWVALTPSLPENGGLRVVPGSQHHRVRHTETYRPDNLLSRGQQIDAEVDAGQAVDIRLLPGEMSLHHSLTIHGSAANGTAFARIGFAIRYAPVSVWARQSDKGAALIVRGCYDGAGALGQASSSTA